MVEVGLRVALLGAESTGKTALSLALGQALHDCGIDCTVVPEYLREWCDREARTPRPEEQTAIAREQARRILEATRHAALVLADTTPMMTAVYSDLLFQDTRLYADAARHQQGYALTLLTGLDLPWVADGLQRDGPEVREPVDARLRQAMGQHGLPYQVVYGTGERRLQNALLALSRLSSLPRRERLLDRLASLRDEQVLNRPWRCENCSDGSCEHKLFSSLLSRTAPN